MCRMICIMERLTEHVAVRCQTSIVEVALDCGVDWLKIAPRAVEQNTSQTTASLRNRSVDLRNCHGDIVGRSAFHPGGVDTFYVVGISCPTLDGAIHIRRLGVNGRVEQLIRGTAAC